MKVTVFFTVCIAAAQAGIIAYPFGAPTLVRTPALDSAVIQSDRLGGNFAYTALSGHSYAAFNPLSVAYAHPYAHPYPFAFAPSLINSNVIPGNFIAPVAPIAPVVPVETPKDAEEKPAEEKPAEETPAETPAEEEKPAEEQPEEEPQAPATVDESIGEENNDGADESLPETNEETPLADDSVSVDAEA